MPELDLTLLGPPAVRVNGRQRTKELPQKPLALLCFLARQPGPQSRSRVAGLLWPEVDEDAARANLRVALSRLRKTLGDCFDAGRQIVGLDPAWVIRDDVAPFLDAAEHGRWAEAAAGYGGPFLEGLELLDAAPFTEWLIVERERIHQLAVRALDHTLQQALTDGAWEQGMAIAQRLLGLDPWRESAHRGLMHSLAAAGQRAAALAQYERCRALLATELDIEPAAATVALYEAIRAAAPGTPFQPLAERRVDRPVHRLPQPREPLIGRAAELRLLLDRLRKPEGRLVTVTGLGGAGKSRLALAAAQQLAADPERPFTDGVVWVPLATIERAENVLTAIAAALGFALSGAAAPGDQLGGYLRHKRLLLVLDNFEQLVPHATLLSELLQEAPGLTLLVTSRERLRLADEWIVALGGLQLPASATALETSPAIQLFAARALRTNRHFDLQAEADGVRAICRQVEGLPLGLELAASWTYAFSCADIAQAMERELDALAAVAQDVPRRHRSLRAAFEHSWQLLRPEEQAALMQVAVFRGGFTLLAAERVAGADRRLLANLIDKSLVRRSGGRRYDLHELLRQFAWGKLADAERPPLEGRYAAYVAGLVRAWLPALDTPDQAEAFQTMRSEIENIRAVWALIVDRRQAALLDHMADGMALFYLRQGLQREGFAAFAAAARMLEQLAAGAPVWEPLLARLLVWQGRCGELLSKDFAIPRRLFEKGLMLARKHALSLATAQAYLGLGLVALYQGQLQQAQTMLEAAQATAAAAGHRLVQASSVHLLGWLALSRRDLPTGRLLCEEALALQKTHGDESGMAATLTTLGTIHRYGDDPDAARAAYQEALARAQNIGHRIGQSQALIGLADVTAGQGQFAAAREYAAASLEACRDVDNRLGMGIALHTLGYVAAAQADQTTAVRRYREALAIYAQLGGDAGRTVNTQSLLAESLLALDRRAEARETLCAALAELTPALQARFAAALLRAGAQVLNRPVAADPAKPEKALQTLAAALGCQAAPGGGAG